MKRASLFSLLLTGALGVSAFAGGNGSGTGDHDPERDILDLAVLGGNGSGTGDHDPERDILDLV